ncbi:hypothetical protein ACERII_00440 [Evansella sp. AB-rgal1]|uniref:hypothetical protein n=1 Tax=Evansella sp. AB-rgal1 TaxID=3242696 RepID=UPI00359CFDC7
MRYHATTIQTLPAPKKEQINQKLKELHPDRNVNLTNTFDYQTFSGLLKNNDIHVDLDEMLERFIAQAVCKEYCETLLKQKTL